ncbi:unnamed protein product [Lampetra fluviatilis]
MGLSMTSVGVVFMMQLKGYSSDRKEYSKAGARQAHAQPRARPTHSLAPGPRTASRQTPWKQDRLGGDGFGGAASEQFISAGSKAPLLSVASSTGGLWSPSWSSDVVLHPTTGRAWRPESLCHSGSLDANARRHFCLRRGDVASRAVPALRGSAFNLQTVAAVALTDESAESSNQSGGGGGCPAGLWRAVLGMDAKLPSEHGAWIRPYNLPYLFLQRQIQRERRGGRQRERDALVRRSTLKLDCEEATQSRSLLERQVQM